MSNPNNTPEQKAAWTANKKKLGSRFIKVIPASRYRPEKKAPSRRDRHRMEVRGKIEHPTYRESDYYEILSEMRK